MRRAIAALMVALSLVTFGCGCSDAYETSRALSESADRFEITRRVTVFNVRTNEVMWQLTGNFSVQYSNGDLDIIVDRGNGLYQKFFFKNSEWTTYLVEDLNNSDYPPYVFDLQFADDGEE